MPLAIFCSASYDRVSARAPAGSMVYSRLRLPPRAAVGSPNRDWTKPRASSRSSAV